MNLSTKLLLSNYIIIEEYISMTNDAIKLVSGLQPNVESVRKVANFLGLPIEKVESIQDKFENETIFCLQRPGSLDGIFAYVGIEEKLTNTTRANQYKGFFQKASLGMEEKGETSSEVDFIITIGEGILIIFDSADYRRRLILTADKLMRKNSKYLKKFKSLKAESLLVNNNYVEDEDFGFIELNQDFKNELFRFAIAEDEQFVAKTRSIRANLLKRIHEDERCQKFIDNIFLNNSGGRNLNRNSNYYGEIVSAVLDTLVLRYILVRILEGRFGYENEFAKKSVSKIGLGTAMTIDELLENNVHFDYEKKEKKIKNGNQLDLFEISAESINKTAVAKVQEEQPNYMTEVYGGDLYVSDIAKAATQIEESLSEEEYALIWNLTSSSDLDFDLADVTPGTIGEQYEQTLKMKLEKDESGEWQYSKDNTQQKSQGAFYTNSKITDYIIEQTLGKKLADIKKKLQSTTNNKNKIKILKSVLNLKMADITSGGGTFLAGAVRKLGNWYSELEQMSDVKPLLEKVKELKSAVSFQKYAINNMIYGVDVDLKALIVSSFALTLESLGEKQEKLPELIGKTLINQNSVISVVPRSEKRKYFSAYQEEIKKLYAERKLWREHKKNNYLKTRDKLQKSFAIASANYLKTKKYNSESLENTFKEKKMEVLEFNIPEVFFNKDGEYIGGFDIIFGNPPYIQLQKKQIFSDEEKYVYKKLGEFECYEATGDIYALFYERAVQLLKDGGLLGFITSNKFLRAGYGKSLRNYLLENTNPLMLVNLGADMFGASVDTCILVLEKSKNVEELQVVDLTKRSEKRPEKRLENMSDYIEQNKLQNSYQKDESWLILSPIEQSIKNKIETVGTPLKDWNVRINRGVLTGCNEAFIINESKKNELVEQDPKSAEIIRPILRGKDIRKNSYHFADKYLITTYNQYTDSKGIIHPSINVNNYPAVKMHLDKYWDAISKRQDKGDTPYNLRRCAYMDDFNKPKIMFSEIVRSPQFYLDTEKHFVPEATAFILCSEDYNLLKTLIDWLNSPVLGNIFKVFYAGGGLGDTGYRYKKKFLQNLPIPKTNNRITSDSDIYSVYGFNEEEINFISSVVKPKVD